MISSVSKLLLAALVFNVAPAFAAPVRRAVAPAVEIRDAPDSVSPPVARSIVDIPVPRDSTTVSHRSLSRRRARLVAPREVDQPVLKSRDTVLVEERNSEESHNVISQQPRRYPRRIYFEHYEKRSPSSIEMERDEPRIRIARDLSDDNVLEARCHCNSHSLRSLVSVARLFERCSCGDKLSAMNISSTQPESSTMPMMNGNAPGGQMNNGPNSSGEMSVTMIMSCKCDPHSQEPGPCCIRPHGNSLDMISKPCNNPSSMYGQSGTPMNNPSVMTPSATMSTNGPMTVVTQAPTDSTSAPPLTTTGTASASNSASAPGSDSATSGSPSATASGISQSPSASATLPDTATGLPPATSTNTGSPSATSTNTAGLPLGTSTDTAGSPLASSTDTAGLPSATSTDTPGSPSGTSTDSAGLPLATSTDSAGLPSATPTDTAGLPSGTSTDATGSSSPTPTETSANGSPTTSPTGGGGLPSTTTPTDGQDPQSGTGGGTAGRRSLKDSSSSQSSQRRNEDASYQTRSEQHKTDTGDRNSGATSSSHSSRSVSSPDPGILSRSLHLERWKRTVSNMFSGFVVKRNPSYSGAAYATHLRRYELGGVM